MSTLFISYSTKDRPSAEIFYEKLIEMPAGQHPSLRERKSDIFIFSRWFSGGPATGYFDTADLERLDPHWELATVMAISGASGSPFISTKKTPASLLFAVLNIRLGYWVPLPKRWRVAAA